MRPRARRGATAAAVPATILAVDTATERCSVALARGERLDELAEAVGQKHSERVLPMVRALLKEHRLRLDECDAIAFGAYIYLPAEHGNDVITGIWKDGKVGTVYGLRDTKTGYKVTAFGTDKIVEQTSGGDYTPMLREIVRFFRTGKAPVSLEETIEIYAFMEAADESKRRGGTPVSVAETLSKAGW